MAKSRSYDEMGTTVCTVYTVNWQSTNFLLAMVHWIQQHFQSRVPRVILTHLNIPRIVYL
jgi:hypothetical protein